MRYRNLSSGGSQTVNVSLDGYVFALDQTRTVQSITLPIDSNLVLLSMVLANEPVSASLASYYNRAGIYTDGTTFTNPPTGGFDGGSAALSGTLPGSSQVWSNTLFTFGPVNATNVIELHQSDDFIASRKLFTRPYACDGRQWQSTFAIFSGHLLRCHNDQLCSEH